MAEDVGSLYLRLGLNLSELETGFVTASQTVAANISRLSRESQTIRIRSQVEIAGLDEVADAEQIAQIRTNALNQQLAIQRDRVRILTAELQNVTTAHGANSAATQRATIRLERERLALAQLESELQNLTNTTQESNGSFGDLSNLLPEIPTKLQAIGMAAGAMTTGINFAVESTQEMIENFRELQQQSYELNMSFNDTEQFLREMKLAGGDIGDFEGYIRGITDAWVKGEYDDPEFIALRKYGAEITDATGRLKDFKDITEEVYQAWKKADEAGEGIEFLQLTGGESGIRDAIQYFKRLEEAREDAAKIYDANLDADQLHELDRSFALVEEQAEKLKDALGNIFTPAAQASAEKFFNLFHDATEWLVENKDEIQRWGFIASEVFSELAPKFESLLPSEQLQSTIESFKKVFNDISNVQLDLGDEKANETFEKLQADAEKFYSGSPTNKLWDNVFDSDLFKDNFLTRAIKRAEEAQKEFNGELEESGTLAEKLAESISKGAELVNKAATGDPLSQYGWQRLEKFKDELEDLRIELDFGDNDYEKSKAQLDLWRDRELNDKLSVSLKEKQAIEELYAAKLEQIEQERADKIAEIQKSVEAEFKTSLENRIDKINEEKDAWISAGMEEAEATELAQERIAKAYEESNEKIQEHWKNAADIEYEMTHTAFEKQLRDIEKWEEAQRQKAETAEEIAGIIAESAAKEAQAFEREVDRIKGLTQSLEDEIFEMENSQYEVDRRRALQKAQKALDEGVDFSTVQRYLQDKFGQIDKRAAESRAKGGDYTKSPEAAIQRGGNGIMVIEGDQIVDDGLIRAQQQVIGLMTDENRIRAQLMQGLSAEQRARIAENQVRRETTDVQKLFAQSTRQAVDGFQIIEGDQVVSNPQSATPTGSGFQIIEGDQIVSGLQEFSGALDQVKTEFEPLDTLKSFNDAQKALAEAANQAAQNFPTEYFKELATATRDLIDAQKSLAETINAIEPQSENPLQKQPTPPELIPMDNFWQDLPTDNLQRQKIPAGNDDAQKLMLSSTKENIFALNTYTQNFDGAGEKLTVSTQGIIDRQGALAESTQNVIDAQNRFIGSTKQKPEPTAQPANVNQDGGYKIGFDYDTAKDIFLTGVGLAATSASTGVGLAFSPGILAGAIVAAGVGGLAKGSYDETTKQDQTQYENLPKESSPVDFSELISPLNGIDENVQSILREMQAEKSPVDDRLQEFFGTLPNIEQDVNSLLLEMQNRQLESAGTPAQETTISFDTIVAPLNNISTVVGNILSALGSRQPPQITVAPNNSINLGGAYVFDNAMKQSLVEDITRQVVSEITAAVQQATSGSDYSYST